MIVTDRSTALHPAPSSSPDVAGGGDACLDCGAPLHGPCCSQCGQRVRESDPTLGDLATDAWDAFISVDGRVLSTLRRLVVHPGALTAEYLAGRRTRYMAPLRLYLLCSAAYFFFHATVPTNAAGRAKLAAKATADSVEAERARLAAPSSATTDSLRRVVLARAHLPVATSGPLSEASRITADSISGARGLRRLRYMPQWLANALAGPMSRRRNRIHRDPEWSIIMPRLMFVVMPVFAALLAIAYRSRRRKYLVHLTVSLHLHAFAFLVFCADHASSLALPDRYGYVLGIPLVIWPLAYLPLALRRVYGGRLLPACGRAAAVLGSYVVIVLLATIVTMFVKTFILA